MTTELSARRDELAAGLAATRARIAVAESAAGREVGSVDLVVVTKFFPASDVRLLADLGVRDVGENRHQEAEAKAFECADLGLNWHFIGGLQTNKAAAVARYATVVESVDRADLIPRLARGAAESAKVLDVLLQVSLELGSQEWAGSPDPGLRNGQIGPLSSTPGRAGADAQDLDSLAAAAAEAGLRVRGLMAVAPLAEDPAAAFARLRAVRTQFLESHPDASVLSAGMSGDLEQAIAAGATHVRVGSAILGSRPSVK